MFVHRSLHVHWNIIPSSTWRQSTTDQQDISSSQRRLSVILVSYVWHKHRHSQYLHNEFQPTKLRFLDIIWKPRQPMEESPSYSSEFKPVLCKFSYLTALQCLIKRIWWNLYCLFLKVNFITIFYNKRMRILIEPGQEKTYLWGLWQGETKTGLPA